MNATKRFLKSLTFSVGIVIASLTVCQAAIITFDYNTLVDDASNLAVQNYMNTLIQAAHPGGSVVVAGARGEANYTGDGHVVGPIVGAVGHRSVLPLTLGNTDASVLHGAPLDTFLINRMTTDRIRMVFSFPVYRVSFDYEIFPDATCPRPSLSCGPASANWPDFKFAADGTEIFRTLSIDPLSGPYHHSPASGLSSNERGPQFLGVSGEHDFLSGVHTLEFIDWPTAIGIDNLVIHDYPPDQERVIPEPGTLLLLGPSLLGWVSIRRFFRI